MSATARWKPSSPLGPHHLSRRHGPAPGQAWSISKSQPQFTPVILTATERAVRGTMMKMRVDGSSASCPIPCFTTRSAPLEYAPRPPQNPEGDQKFIHPKKPTSRSPVLPAFFSPHYAMHLVSKNPPGTIIAPQRRTAAFVPPRLPRRVGPWPSNYDAPGEVRPEQIDLVQHIAASTQARR